MPQQDRSLLFPCIPGFKTNTYTPGTSCLGKSMLATTHAGLWARVRLFNWRKCKLTRSYLLLPCTQGRPAQPFLGCPGAGLSVWITTPTPCPPQLPEQWCASAQDFPALSPHQPSPTASHLCGGPLREPLRPGTTLQHFQLLHPLALPAHQACHPATSSQHHCHLPDSCVVCSLMGTRCPRLATGLP